MESAIAIPVSLFVVLGVLQMSLVHQARLFADYSAYRAAREASLNMCTCRDMEAAAISALVPTLGRADDQSTWKTTYDKAATAESGALAQVRLEYKLNKQIKPFDKPLGTDEEPERVSVKVHYYYEMKVPFVNWLIARYYLAQNMLEAWAGQVDAIQATAKLQQPANIHAASQEATIAKVFFLQKRYVIPIYSSWTMRMFSQCKDTSGSCP